VEGLFDTPAPKTISTPAKKDEVFLDFSSYAYINYISPRCFIILQTDCYSLLGKSLEHGNVAQLN
jgi:hypothetical protein